MLKLYYRDHEFEYQEAISSTIKLNDEGLVIGLLEFLQNDKKIKVKIKQKQNQLFIDDFWQTSFPPKKWMVTNGH